ncbi:MAG: MmcQ/YjbR family DNA-binding protein [Clostridiales bacterium]|nr:MmcQ/YjbR family DNA-binding protein [Clostridiales bacterium]
MGATRDTIYEYADNQYGTSPEHLWAAFPLYSVLRRADNKKWYAIIMNVPMNKLGLNSDEYVDVLDIKCDPLLRDELLTKPGILPAYHLNRKHWISVLLDGTVDEDTALKLLADSYEIAGGKSKRPTIAVQKSWLVPANPKYYDIERAFAENDIILWKQSSRINVGDTVYLYIASPYSCIMYKCEAVEVDIPYEYSDENVRMDKVMRIKRLHTYDKGAFGVEALKKHGVVSVRGPRSVPFGLRAQLEESGDGT